MTLPVKTTTEDLARVVEFLKNRASGSTVTEARGILGPSCLDGRKLSGYETWGFVSHDGDRIALTNLGRQLARASEAEMPGVYAQSLSGVPPYRSGLEWIHYQSLKEPTVADVGAYWRDNYRLELASEQEATLRDTAVCFFHLCEGAQLGKVVVGRRGQPTRLEVSSPALASFIGTPVVAPEEGGAEGTATEAQPITESLLAVPVAPGGLSVTPGRRPRVFISHSKNRAILEQIKTMLAFADLECEVAEEQETAAIPVPQKVLAAMLTCSSATICVTADETEKRGDETYGVNENVLIEIGAAFVLYDQRVVLVWDRRVQVPSNLQGLYRCEFSGDELSWVEGMKFMNAVNDLRAGKAPG